MKNILTLFIGTLLLTSCANEPEVLEWASTNQFKVEGVNPIGLAVTKDGLWLSDGDHNRLVNIDAEGKIIKSVDGFERPMHIASQSDVIYVPEYGTDTVKQVNAEKVSAISLNDSLDAPAGIDIYNNEKAIADFYNNRILYFNGTDWISFGKEGKAEGDFYYPTDVQITEDEIWVADAYNNRVQVFDKSGNFKKVIGADQKMNAATGIYVSDDELFVTDFENDRVLIFDLDGQLKQELSENIEKPTDMLIYNNELYIINYRNSIVNVFQQKAVKVEKE
ncbi:NHL repeat-containing protein [Winogradskyella sp. A3E31]|uniref:NHL repeat-containing protein n=1 Tax=Winogradskyella sp. A3E31 TaxID=3349637 RepID=UPI00398B2BBB